MNRFVQKLIAGAAAVAIAVTGLLGGAPVAKAADPTTGTITISNASGDTATHTLDGWKLASLKNVASADGKLTFLIDTNNAMVPLIEASMTRDQLALYKADANYYTENGKEKQPDRLACCQQLQGQNSRDVRSVGWKFVSAAHVRDESFEEARRDRRAYCY